MAKICFLEDNQKQGKMKMSEYKKMSDWAKEIGLVPGMKFENKHKQYDFEIIEVRPHEIRVRWLENNNIQIQFIPIDYYSSVYILSFDPRSENNIKKEVEMNLAEELKKNCEEFYSNKIKDTTDYKDFETKLRYELIAYSKKYGEREYTYNFFMSNKELELKMVKIFCAENGLTFKHDFYSVISW